MCLHLARIGHANTIMTFWDIEEATQVQFRADLKTLTTFYNTALGKPRDVVDKIRPVLESYCRNLLPMQFDDDDALGVICGRFAVADLTILWPPFAMIWTPSTSTRGAITTGEIRMQRRSL